MDFVIKINRRTCTTIWNAIVSSSDKCFRTQVAKDVACARTKTSYIISEMHTEREKNLVDNLKNSRGFSISMDGSADKCGKSQLYPTPVRYFNPQLKKIVTEVLSIPAIKESSTGENIFKLVDSELKKVDLSWEKCLCFCSDNASVMMGNKKGVAAYDLFFISV